MTRRRPADAPPPVHSDAAHRAITAELVRLTLCSRRGERTELFFGLAALAHRVGRVGRLLASAGVNLTDLQANLLVAVLRRQEGRTR